MPFMAAYPSLFQPFPINGVTLPNRIVLPAMVTRLSGEDGVINADIMDRYVRFAKGEPGLIVVEAMAVHTAKSGPLLRIGTDEFKPGLTELAKRVHAAGPAKVVPQIIHFLKIARSGWRQMVGVAYLVGKVNITHASVWFHWSGAKAESAPNPRVPM